MNAPLNPPLRTLLGPGPSDIHPRVLDAIGKPTVGHLDPYYLQVMNDLQGMLRSLFRTQNEMTMAISATGSAGMETTIVNLVEPGDPVLVCINGVFGMRMADVAERAGAQVTTLERPWGEVFRADELAEAMRFRYFWRFRYDRFYFWCIWYWWHVRCGALFYFLLVLRAFDDVSRIA